MIARVVVLMGVTGSGKTTIAEALGARLGWDAADADRLHSTQNIAKMAAGQALDDTDRLPWLHRVRQWIDTELAAGRAGVIACSALKRAYREMLRRDEVTLVFLAVDRDVIRQRLEARTGHFMAPEMLDSQLAVLEPPAPDEGVLIVEANAAVEVVVDQIVAALDAISWQAG